MLYWFYLQRNGLEAVIMSFGSSDRRRRMAEQRQDQMPVMYAFAGINGWFSRVCCPVIRSQVTS